MRKLTKQEIEILQRHQRWLEGKADGQRADLQGADLRGAYLQGAYLQGAYLQGAYLQGADLRGAYLQGAYLQGADLRGAYLQRAYLQGAYLQGAYLQRAYLQGADLQGAYLQGADLRGADLQRAYLQGADLQGAYLQGADLRGAKVPAVDLARLRVCPAGGEFMAWKAGCGGHIMRLLIPAWSRRMNALGSRKCRAECVVVESIWDANGKPVQKCGGWRDKNFIYEVGQVAGCGGNYSDDVREECAPGIHFFMTREEAVEWAEN